MSRVVAAIYDRFMRKTEEAGLCAWRAELLERARGNVLEIGAGTGANLPHYREVDRLVLAEPDPHMRRRLETKLGAATVPTEVIDASVEDIPAADGTFDVVVSTLLLCSVRDQARALAEIYRVLGEGGSLLFLEHVAAHDNPGRLRWQHRVEPVWKLVSDGCHVTRDTHGAILEAGFEIQAIERESMRKAWPWLRPTIRGVARKYTP